MMWTPQVGMKVEVNGMGPGTIVKLTPTGALVQIERFRLQVDLKLDAMRPAEISGNNQSSSPKQENKDATLDLIDEIIGAKGNHRGAAAASATFATSDKAVQTQSPPKPQPKQQVQRPVAQTQPPQGTRIVSLPMDPVRLQARKTLESLRFGLVPNGHIEQLTMGFSAIKDWAFASFPEKGFQRMHKVVGPYGTGKSHTMAVLRYLAEQAGYLVAKVEVDGNAISLSEPARLINALWNSVRGHGFETESPLLSLYERAIQYGYTPHSVANLHLTKLTDNMATIQLLARMGYTETYQDMIEGVLNGSEEYTATEVNSRLSKEPNLFLPQLKLRSPISRAVAERSHDFLEALVSCAVLSRMAGFKGLVITIDEFEVEVNLTKSKQAQLMEVIDVVGSYMRGENRSLPASPLAVYLGTLGQITNPADARLDQICKQSSGMIYTLGTWQKEQRLELAQKIYALYQQSYMLGKPYSGKIAEEVHSLMENRGYDDSGMLRQFIKWYVTFLDMLYGPPEVPKHGAKSEAN
ncbi:BREX system ATP-binding domain-containing protein [Brevibacillus nitrificans]|nr:BREX system ATP-binding domain-containing protein [Brevibacillus nitrificans]